VAGRRVGAGRYHVNTYPFFQAQAGEQIGIALLVLDAQRALRMLLEVLLRLGQRKAVRHLELALVLELRKQRLKDLAHGLVLKDPGVGAVGHKSQPRLQRELVAGQAPVRAQASGVGDVPVPAARGPGLVGQQLQQRRLAQQPLERQVRVFTQGP
jgi:hypothetical protein